MKCFQINPETNVIINKEGSWNAKFHNSWKILVRSCLRISPKWSIYTRPTTFIDCHVRLHPQTSWYMAAVVSWVYRCLREALHQFPSSRTTRFAQIHLLFRSWFRITPWSPRRIDRFTSNFYPAKEHISETSQTEYQTQGWSVDVCRPCTLSGFFFLEKKTRSPGWPPVLLKQYTFLKESVPKVTVIFLFYRFDNITIQLQEVVTVE